MEFYQAIILSIIEGITEFLPVSSTGHLILSSDILGITQTDFVKSFEIVIQLGAILAVLAIYRNILIKDYEAWKRIGAAFLPTAIIGFGFYKIIKNLLLGNTVVTLIALLVGGLVLILLEKIYREEKSSLQNISEISLKKSFLIGIFQAVSVIPGVSRSAATIFGGLFLGLKRKTAVEFSFLLAIPTMFAATGFDLIKNAGSFDRNNLGILLLGFFGSFVTAYFSVKYFLRYIEHHNFIPFGVYRIVIAVIFWLFIVR